MCFRFNWLRLWFVVFRAILFPCVFCNRSIRSISTWQNYWSEHVFNVFVMHKTATAYRHRIFEWHKAIVTISAIHSDTTPTAVINLIQRYWVKDCFRSSVNKIPDTVNLFWPKTVPTAFWYDLLINIIIETKVRNAKRAQFSSINWSRVDKRATQATNLMPFANKFSERTMQTLIFSLCIEHLHAEPLTHQLNVGVLKHEFIVKCVTFNNNHF